MMFGLTTTDREKMCHIFARFPEIESVIIFGSRAMGNHKKGSDIDLALKGSIPEDTLRRVKSTLEELPLPYCFDVVLYEQIENTELKTHIDEHGRVLYRAAGSY